MQDLMRQLPGSQPTTTIAPSFQPRINQQQLVSGVNKANEAKDAKSQNLAMMLYALGGAFRGQDPLQQGLALQQAQQQRQLQLQQKQQEEKIKQVAAGDPNLQRMYDVFGKEGLQQAYGDLLSQERQAQAFKQAGLSKQTQALIAAGLSVKDAIELSRQEQISAQYKTPEQLTAEVEQQKLEDPTSLKKLENIEEAFGGVDAFQQKFNELVGPIFGTPFKETAEAVSAKNVLNERVREKFLNQYAGRPSVYLNQRVDLLLPQGQYVDESVAASKYEDTKKVLQEGLNEMKTKLQSGLYTGTERLEVEQNYKDIQSIISDLDVAVKSLKSATPDPKVLDPNTMYRPTGAYDSFYTNNVSLSK